MKAISFVFALILCISLGKYGIVSDEPVGCIVRGLRKVENVKYTLMLWPESVFTGQISFS